MSIFHAIILGIIEGVTEFLPVSSTGHMILASTLLHIPQTEFAQTFEIVIQLGAILAMALLYCRTLLAKQTLLIPLIAAFLPTSIIGLVAYKTVKHHLLGNPIVTVVALAFGGVAFIAIEYILKKQQPKIMTIEKITIPQAVGMGIGQSLSFIPGVSRAAATIFTGMLTGLSRQTAVEFSFLLAIPTMIAASALEIIKSKPLLDNAFFLPVVTGTVVAFITVLITVKGFIRYIQTHTFIPFGIYRILLSFAFWIVFLP